VEIQSKKSVRPQPKASGGFYIPKEHGGWALLAVPPIVGFVAAGGASSLVIFQFFMGALGAYLLRTPLEAFFNNKLDPRPLRFAALYGVVAAAAFLPLILFQDRAFLALFGVCAAGALILQLWLGSQHLARSAGGEIFGIVVLALGAPAAYYTATGLLNADSLRLWALNAVFFVGPVFYIKMVVAGHVAFYAKSPDDKYEEARRVAFLYHGASALLAALAGWAGAVPMLVTAPFIISLAKVLWRGRPKPAPAKLQRVGWQEVIFSLVFVALIGVSF
jgi:hypothetical protein